MSSDDQRPGPAIAAALAALLVDPEGRILVVAEGAMALGNAALDVIAAHVDGATRTSLSVIRNSRWIATSIHTIDVMQQASASIVLALRCSPQMRDAALRCVAPRGIYIEGALWA